jgi:signal transduction histidine kinase
VAITPDLGNVTLDRQKFKQVLYSLVSSAVKFTKNGGQVEILAAPHSRDHFKLFIRSTGIGKPEDLSRLFTEFERLESDISRRHEGSGLALGLTRKIVQLQGGTIGVESEAGKGSTFTVTLPRVCTEPAKQTEEECQFAMAPERL